MTFDTKKYAAIWVLRDPTWITLRDIQTELIRKKEGYVAIGDVVRILIESYREHSDGHSAPPKND